MEIRYRGRGREIARGRDKRDGDITSPLLSLKLLYIFPFMQTYYVYARNLYILEKYIHCHCYCYLSYELRQIITRYGWLPRGEMSDF